MSKTTTATESDLDSSGDGDGDDWDGYADYRVVAGQIARAVDDATTSYALIVSHATERGKMSKKECIEAKRYLLAAAYRLLPELHKYDNQEIYRDILHRWEGVDSDSDVDAPTVGQINRLKQTRLKQIVKSGQTPTWLDEFSRDIRRAAFELGYLQAGRVDESSEDIDGESSIEELIE